MAHAGPRVSRAIIAASTVELLAAAFFPAFGAEGLGDADIVVDQFGYPNWAQKIAVVRDPQIGFDAGRHFAPGEIYALVNSDTGEKRRLGRLKPWRAGAADASSGDRAYWFDFSA